MFAIARTLWAGGAGDTAAAGGADMAATLVSFVPILLIVGVFYFFIIRPESKRKKETARMRNELMVGDEITTIGGICGRIITMNDDSIVLESGADRSKIKIMRWAVSARGQQSTETNK